MFFQEIRIGSNSVNIFQEMNIDTEQNGISNILYSTFSQQSPFHSIKLIFC